ncbi:hypothetical protein NDU88_001684 [Pleurodeles waltl]|uniref:Uncharacterized protein n=1 Tax=Pleurodeles waltl TaxID=8319 RepID=A0AAV7UXF6_PLEWA|nr:hypothetical protein NDU88_001684 [Pleurodeles waltl]
MATEVTLLPSQRNIQAKALLRHDHAPFIPCLVISMQLFPGFLEAGSEGIAPLVVRVNGIWLLDWFSPRWGHGAVTTDLSCLPQKSTPGAPEVTLPRARPHTSRIIRGSERKVLGRGPLHGRRLLGHRTLARAAPRRLAQVRAQDHRKQNPRAARAAPRRLAQVRAQDHRKQNPRAARAARRRLAQVRAQDHRKQSPHRGTCRTLEARAGASPGPSETEPI